MLLQLYNLHVLYYMSPLSSNLINVIGFLLFVTYMVQLVSGMLLSMYYSSYLVLAFDSVANMMMNVNNGWFMRLLHMMGASVFMFLLLLHFNRALYLKLYSVYILFYSMNVVVSGYILFVLMLLEGFIGYVLVWGQMSYWGTMMMINIVAVIPLIGMELAELMWSAVWVMLNSIFVYHFLVGLLMGLFMLVHLILLHSYSSSNPYLYNSNSNLSFLIYIFKDVLVLTYLLFIVSLLLYLEPDILGNCNNQIKANPLITPNNILPEWYYLMYYSILSSFPNKMIGVILIVVLMVMLI